MQARWEAVAAHGLATLQRVGARTSLWSFSPPGENGQMRFDLGDIRRARRPLLRRLRDYIGEFMWVFQGPEVVQPGRLERLGMHLIAAGEPVDERTLAEIVDPTGFGGNVDVREIDQRPNSSSDVARYIARHLARDGYRLTEHYPHVVLAYTSPAWPREELQ